MCIRDSSWGDVFDQAKNIGMKNIVAGLTAREAGSVSKTLDAIFRPVRQPTWWQGDSLYHAPKYTEPASELERRLKAGEFVVAAEVTPALSMNTEKMKQNIELLKPYVAAINFTDSPSAIPRMSSLACSKLALEQDAEPVMQMTARDRTRVGLQSEVLGASALGVRNILCLTGASNVLGPCLLYTSPSPRDRTRSRMPPSA